MPHKNKAQRAKNEAYNRYLYGSVAVSQCLFLQRLARHWAKTSTIVFVAYIVTTLACLWCARTIAKTRDTARVLDIQEGNIGVSYHLDVLIISVVAISGSAVLSDYFFMCFICVPTYIFYRGAKALLSWVFTPTESEMEENLLMQQRKMQKSRGKRSNKYSQRRR